MIFDWKCFLMNDDEEVRVVRLPDGVRVARGIANATRFTVRGDVAEGILLDGRTLRVDAADLPLVDGFAWTVGADGRVVTRVHAVAPWIEVNLDLAGLLVNRRHGPAVRFVNGDPLDCRRANLVLVAEDEE